MTNQPTNSAIVSLANLPKGMTLAQLVNPGSGKRYDRIWRLVPGQPIDAKNRVASGKFYLTRTVNDRTDPTKKIVEYSLGINEPDNLSIQVLPMGYNLDRELGTYNQDDNTYTQRCHSNDFRNPDARYMGKVIAGAGGLIAHKCSEIRMKTYPATGEPKLDENGNVQYYLHKLCPLANFSAPKVEGGKSTKPECSEVYTIYVAVKAPFVNPEDKTKPIWKWVAAEINMRVMQAKLGEGIVARLGMLEGMGLPLSTYPLELTLDEYTQSGTVKNAYKGKLLTTETDKSIITPEEYEDISGIVADAKAQRKKWADYDPDAPKESEQSIITPKMAQETQPTGAATPANPPQGKEITVTATKAPEPELVPDLLF